MGLGDGLSKLAEICGSVVAAALPLCAERGEQNVKMVWEFVNILNEALALFYIKYSVCHIRFGISGTDNLKSNSNLPL